MVVGCSKPEQPSRNQHLRPDGRHLGNIHPYIVLSGRSWSSIRYLHLPSQTNDICNHEDFNYYFFFGANINPPFK